MLKNFIKKKIPLFVLFFLQKIILIKRLITIQNRYFFCNYCEKKIKGYYTGYPPYGLELTCPHCFSVGRNRLLIKYLKTINTQKYKILHFAPENCVEKVIKKKLFKEYKRVDLFPKADQEMCDIENITYKKNSFDLIICSHVLEHVNYKKAILNLKKIIKKGGKILLMFPIIQNWSNTYSDSKIIKSKDREIHFGQFDHLHAFGRDVFKQFMNGFEITEIISFGKQSIINGISHGETIFVIKKINDN